MCFSIQKHSLRVCGACVCLFGYVCVPSLHLPFIIVVIGRFLFWFYCNGNGNLPGQKSAMPHQTSKVSQTSHLKAILQTNHSCGDFQTNQLRSFFGDPVIFLIYLLVDHRIVLWHMKCANIHVRVVFRKFFIRISAIKHFQRQVYASLNTNDIDWRKHSYTNHHSNRVQW